MALCLPSKEAVSGTESLSDDRVTTVGITP